MKTKNFIAIFLLSIVVIPLIGISQIKSKQYVLSCQFQGLPDKCKVYLITQEKDTLQRTFSNGESVTFKGELNPEGRFLFITFDTLVSSLPTRAIFVTHKVIAIKGIMGSRDVQVVGSPEQNEYIEIMAMRNHYGKLDNDNQLSLSKSAANIRSDSAISEVDKILQIDQITKQMTEFRSENNIAYNAKFKDWFLNHKESLFIPYAISNYSDLEYTKTLIDESPRSVKQSYYGIKLKKELESMALAEKIRQGTTVPDFKVSSTDGASFSVLEYAKKGKITLIDFWASWCSPCRAETPNMKKVYEALHDKGFNIIGISSDAKETDWKKALEEDNTPWFHGRDNLDKATKSIFSIGAIPAFALVDGEGKLIAFSCAMSNIPSFGPEIRGEGLYNTIEKLLNKEDK